LIKVVTGVHRCGKSTLLEVFRTELKLSGISEYNIISLNFEECENVNFVDWTKLYDEIIAKTNPNEKFYIFLCLVAFKRVGNLAYGALRGNQFASFFVLRIHACVSGREK
jgi:hypothetical protein